jgi:hypothetical protein
MTDDAPLTRDSFMSLAKEAGLDVDDPHMDELFLYTSEMLASLYPLRNVDVVGVEPDSVFHPSQE